ncbi:related to prefoldin subunit 1 [Cephalotrichum gorgonifer]|uniref:Related to prefoldin subunit 1 n=1 Tax=Cephalotrichum gorgonifer TaxID=2041049 RepID=A0AAE8SRQ9_9PEZI|nr:related to prefoldin subunit 1 [Cephalotrichum gorgonifer]
MSISNAALEKLVREIENQAAVAEQQISLSRNQVASKQREKRLLKLTLDEVTSIPQNTPVYEGVGKMFVSTPIPDLHEKLEGQVKTLDDDLDKLQKRLLYLETTQKNSREHIDQMLKHNAGRG